MNSRRITLLLLAVMVATPVLCLLFMNDGPKHQGMTANQWVYAAARQQVTGVEFEKAIEVLNTNFVPVAIRFAQTRKTFVRVDQWYTRFEKWLPKNTVKIIPPKFAFHQALVWDSLFRLQRYVPVEPARLSIDSALKNGRTEDQLPLAGMLFCLLAREDQFPLNHEFQGIGHTNFPVRLYSCITSAGSAALPTASRKAVKTIISVLENAVTNKALMDESFGQHASFWQTRALTSLASVSPGRAAWYQNYPMQ